MQEGLSNQTMVTGVYVKNYIYVFEGSLKHFQTLIIEKIDRLLRKMIEQYSVNETIAFNVARLRT